MPNETQPGKFDLIIIGAGINGAGIARDAAMRGLKVLLLDKGDIGGGTSSWSTRLIHGGLRYLEHGEFRLVRESLRERACLLKVAPHLVRPLPMLVPVYRNARRGLWTIRAGMIAYDLLSTGKGLPRHRMLSPDGALRLESLNPRGLRGAALYFDARVEFAERLVLENALSAIEHGASVITYARVEKLIVEAGDVRGVAFTGNVQSQHLRSKVQDRMPRGEEGGLSTPAGLLRWGPRLAPALTQSFATAPVVINAAGPWVDQVLAEGDSPSPRLIGGTKGSHLIVAGFPSAPDMAIYVEAESDGRPFFIIPWNGHYLIGTTDIRFEGDLDNPQIDDSEIDYLLRETNRVIPRAMLTREQILYTYSGVRPLPFIEAQDEQSITRRHFIREHPALPSLLSIVGGKLTTYRSLAEETVDLVLKKLTPRWDREQLARKAISQSTTAHESLPGAGTTDFNSFCREFKQRSPFPEATSDRWLRIYGTRASLILDLLKADPSLAEVFDDETGARAAEVVFAFEHELATTLADCLLRRTMVGLNSSRGLKAVAAAAAIAGKHLGWSESRMAQEIADYRKGIAIRNPLAEQNKP
jgi:glycerol-3-phosphate dehydrogenase